MFLEFLAGVIAFPHVVALTDLNVWEFAILVVGWFFRRRLIVLSAPVQLRYFVDTLCARPWLGISVIALAGPAIRLLLLPIHPIPVPAISDEFSHLLLADTFHLGRWTNPVHSLWTHFESIHIIHRPSYNSMYFPGQGAVLALGMVLGHPWIGVLLSSALFCGSVVWALQAWIPRRWALLGGCIAVLRFGIVSYWVDSYWGGALGALGGCLIVGAYGRLRKQASLLQGLLLGAGLGLLASVRPLEGALFSAAAATTFLHRFGNPLRWQPMLRTASILAVCTATVSVGIVGYHFYRVTGDPLTSPYAMNRQQYGWPMTLPWQKVVAIEHRHREMRQYYEWERGELEKKSTPLAFAANYPWVFIRLWSFFLGPALTLSLLWTRRAPITRSIKPIACWGTVSFAIVSLEFGYPHYFSPATICTVALAVQSLRHLRSSQRATREGLARYRLVVASLATVSIAAFLMPPAKGKDARDLPAFLSWCCLADAGRERAEIQAYLEAQPGRHVIFSSSHHAEFESIEWTYNGAAIDASRVIWARDMGAERNAEVVRYYPDRKYWEVNSDSPSPIAKPYRASPSNPTVAVGR